MGGVCVHDEQRVAGGEQEPRLASRFSSCFMQAVAGMAGTVNLFACAEITRRVAAASLINATQLLPPTVWPGWLCRLDRGGDKLSKAER